MSESHQWMLLLMLAFGIGASVVYLLKQWADSYDDHDDDFWLGGGV